MTNGIRKKFAALACCTIIPALAAAAPLGMAPQAPAVSAPAPACISPATEESAASVSTYRLGPEDTIEIFVWKEPDVSTEVMVRPDGKISLPLLNELVAGGRTPAELQREISEGLREYLDDPVVSVVVREINSAKISVLGEVRDPGRFLLRQTTTVLDAIAMAGGFTEYANRGKVLVVRDGGTGIERIKIDINDLLDGDDGELLLLRPNDSVYVR